MVRKISTELVLAGIVFISLVSVPRVEAQSEAWAAVTDEQVDVLSGPGENYLLEFTVHEGTALTIEEERGDWWRVRLGGDLEGWVQSDGLRGV